MKTTDKILAAALELFNEKGLDLVTLHQIAQHIGISQGNLNYHFRKREDIVETLYMQLVERMDKEFARVIVSGNPMENLFAFSEGIMKGMYAYRFIMLDFVQTMRRHPTIKKHYRQLYEMRLGQTRQLYDMLIAQGLMRPEAFDGEYDNLSLRGTILGDSWLAEAEILFDLDEKELIPYFQKAINQMMFPYLTTKGQEMYQQAESKYFGSK